MNKQKKRLALRAMAFSLCLALLPALPVIAEEIAIQKEIDDALDLPLQDTEVSEAMVAEIDEPTLIEASNQSGDVIEATSETIQADVAIQSNTSNPAEDYVVQHHSFNVGEKSSYTLMVGDSLEIFFPNGNGKSWISSKPSVARVKSSSDQYSVYLSAIATGTSKLTLTLSTGKKYTITVKVKDPYALKSMTLSRSSVTLMAGMDLNLADYITMKPVYAKPGFTYKSSKSSVAKVTSSGIVIGMKAGNATITIKSDSGVSKKIKVKVKQNITKKLHSAPTKSAARAQGKKWTLWPRSLELLGNGTLVCRLYLLNGSAGKLKSLRNLDLAVSLDTDNGENLIARHTFSKVSVSCSKNSYTTVKLTFPAKSVYYSGVKLSDLNASKLIFRLYSKPTAKNGSHTYSYSASAIEVAGDPSVDNPVAYRALLVSEDDFYFSHIAGNSHAWEHLSRNKNDVALMNTLLSQVRTPDGTRYSINIKHNTSHAGLVSAIQSAFAGADENDVSLFFIATHGDSADNTPSDKAGALYMASLDEAYPESFYLSELRDLLLNVPGKVVVILESCGSGASIVQSNSASARSAQNFDIQAVELFREADPGVIDVVTGDSVAANTGELRKVNKFYVLCCSEYREESWGNEPSGNFFTKWLAQGVGKSGNMPADKQYVGNKNGIVDLHELYRYISCVGDNTLIGTSDGNSYYQHVQVYPSNVRYALFK